MSVSNRLPKPSTERVVKMLREAHGVPDFDPPQWMIDAMIESYQGGRYDEACAETIAAVCW